MTVHMYRTHVLPMMRLSNVQYQLLLRERGGRQLDYAGGACGGEGKTAFSKILRERGGLSFMCTSGCWFFKAKGSKGRREITRP